MFLFTSILNNRKLEKKDCSLLKQKEKKQTKEHKITCTNNNNDGICVCWSMGKGMNFRYEQRSQDTYLKKTKIDREKEKKINKYL